MRNKKGFTLVELVIVIAVIAILAGVMIAVFSGVVKDAQESAELQKLKSEEIAMKADDVMKKLNDEKWFGWEDLEVALANGVAKSLGERVTTIAPEEIESLKTALGNAPTIEQIKEAVKNVTVTTTIDTAALQAAVQSAARDSVRAAFEEYKNAQGSSALTEEQMKAIVKGCFDDSYTGVTEEQMKTIIGTALDSWTATIKESNLTPAQIAAVVAANTVTQRDIQTIVDAAIANKLNTAQASVWVSQIKNQIAGIADDAAALKGAVNDLKNIVQNTSSLTEDDVLAILKASIPVTVESTVANFNKTAKEVLSGSTIVVTDTGSITVSDIGDHKTLYIRGAKLDTLTIDNDTATVYVYNEVTTLDAKAVAMNSLHVYGKVDTLTVKTGRVVLESGAKVETVQATPEAKKTVRLEAVAGATVTNPVVANTANTDSKVFIKSETAVTFTVAANSGEKSIVVEGTEGGTVTPETGTETNNAVEYKTTTDNLFERGSGTESDPYQIATAAQLKNLAVYVNDGKAKAGEFFVLTADIDLTGTVWTPIGWGKDALEADGETSLKIDKDYMGKSFMGNFDGQGHTINGLSNKGYQGGTYVTQSSSGNSGEAFGLFGWVATDPGSSATIKNIKFTNVNIVFAEDGKGVGAVMGTNHLSSNGKDKDTADGKYSSITIDNVTVESGVIAGMDKIGGIAGCIRGAILNLSNCTNNATVSAYTANSYTRAGGIIGQASVEKEGSPYPATISDCTNTGAVSATGTSTGTVFVGAIVGHDNSNSKCVTVTGSSSTTKATAINNGTGKTKVCELEKN